MKMYLFLYRRVSMLICFKVMIRIVMISYGNLIAHRILFRRLGGGLLPIFKPNFHYYAKKNLTKCYCVSNKFFHKYPLSKFLMNLVNTGHFCTTSSHRFFVVISRGLPRHVSPPPFCLHQWLKLDSQVKFRKRNQFTVIEYKHISKHQNFICKTLQCINLYVPNI